MEQLGQISQGVKVFLELPLRNQEKHHQVDQFAIQRVELNPFA